jgi:thymidine kinase
MTDRQEISKVNVFATSGIHESRVLGRMLVITGCMFSGKTETLLQRLNVEAEVQAFKPTVDTRYSAEHITTHTGKHFPAIAVPDIREIILRLKPQTRVVAIDEAQFFDTTIVRVCELLLCKGIDVVVAGLDTDFRGEPYGPISGLLCIADEIVKMHATCSICGSLASRTQKLTYGLPAHYNSPRTHIGGADIYEPRCLFHHRVPGKPVDLARSSLP